MAAHHRLSTINLTQCIFLARQHRLDQVWSVLDSVLNNIYSVFDAKFAGLLLSASSSRQLQATSEAVTHARPSSSTNSNSGLSCLAMSDEIMLLTRAYRSEVMMRWFV